MAPDFDPILIVVGLALIGGAVAAVLLKWKKKKSEPVQAPTPQYRDSTPMPKGDPAGTNGGPGLALKDWYRRHPKDAIVGGALQRTKMTSAVWAKMLDAFQEVKATNRYVPEGPGQDFSEMPANTGDCSHFFIFFKRALVERGVPPTCIRAATCLTARGRHHIVCTMDTTEGTYIFNRADHQPLPWRETNYTRWIREYVDQWYWVEMG